MFEKVHTAAERRSMARTIGLWFAIVMAFAAFPPLGTVLAIVFGVRAIRARRRQLELERQAKTYEALHRPTAEWLARIAQPPR